MGITSVFFILRIHLWHIDLHEWLVLFIVSGVNVGIIYITYYGSYGHTGNLCVFCKDTHE